MSKKKSFTMTLKDFHGGSIPSDLPLPSAPGVPVRQPDRPGFDRPTGGIRHDQYRPSRPGSAGGGSRGFGDDSAPFLPHSTRIGRNFEEDERKPFDPSVAPRRGVVAVESARLRSDVGQQKGYGRPGSSPASMPNMVSSGSAFPSAGFGRGNQFVGSGGVPNAWGVRKEVGSENQVERSGVVSGPVPASRFAQASAIEKISSGRWHTKDVSFSRTPTAEIIRFSDDGGNGFQENDVNGRADGFDRRYNEVKGQMGALGFGFDNARPTSSDGRYSGDRALVQPSLGRYFQQDGMFGGQQVSPLDDKSIGLQVRQQDGKLGEQQGGRVGGAHVRQQPAAEITERPKLNLLPRTKPLEPSETQNLDVKKGFQSTTELGYVENVHEGYGNQKPNKPGSSGSDGESRAVDRARLNLKPHSQPLEHTEVNIEKERKFVFGGARPRELVLKERGCDDPSNDFDPRVVDTRVKQDSYKKDARPEMLTSPSRHTERVDNPFDRRAVRGSDRKDHRAEPEKPDLQRTSWKNDKWRNTKVHEKLVERRPEPDSWRKPIEEPKLEVPSPRHGKAASALELAQAYSRSASNPRSDVSATKPGGIPGHNQVIFSRLTDNREFRSGLNVRKINGY